MSLTSQTAFRLWTMKRSRKVPSGFLKIQRSNQKEVGELHMTRLTSGHVQVTGAHPNSWDSSDEARGHQSFSCWNDTFDFASCSASQTFPTCGILLLVTPVQLDSDSWHAIHPCTELDFRVFVQVLRGVLWLRTNFRLASLASSWAPS